MRRVRDHDGSEVLMAHEAGTSPRHPIALPADARQPDPVMSELPSQDGPLIVDCDTCRARGAGCGDCFVTVLLGGPPDGVTLNDEERRAVEVLAAAGMIPPLRHVYGVESPFLDNE